MAEYQKQKVRAHCYSRFSTLSSQFCSFILLVACMLQQIFHIVFVVLFVHSFGCLYATADFSYSFCRSIILSVARMLQQIFHIVFVLLFVHSFGCLYAITDFPHRLCSFFRSFLRLLVCYSRFFTLSLQFCSFILLVACSVARSNLLSSNNQQRDTLSGIPTKKKTKKVM